jgi:molybdopterin/thiamine biosynthesis adenylyltransferase
MMSTPVEIVFSAPAWASLRTHLFGAMKPGSPEFGHEQMALLLIAPNGASTKTRLVVRELLLAGPNDLTQQSGTGIAPTGEFVAAALTRCRQEGWGLVEVHSHPFSMGPSTTFSGIDWANDRAKMPVLARLLPDGAFHATMVIGQASLDAHYFDRVSSSIRPVSRIAILGVREDAPWLSYESPTHAEDGDAEQPFLVSDRHSRQLPLLGRRTQVALEKATVVVVGLGGLGSFAALECAHLGIGHLVLIDPDDVEITNLNRLMAATENDLKEPKADVYQRLITAISPRTKVTSIVASILADDALVVAKQGDLLLGCVDNHGARLVLNHLAVQYVIPLLDAGTGARLDSKGALTHAGGQVQAVLPGLGCLLCRGFIDTRQAAFDLAPAHVRQREIDHGYGTLEPAPSVVYLNGIVASLQVTEAVKLLSGTILDALSSRQAITRYDMLGQSLLRATVTESDTCPTCGPDGVAGLADLSPLQSAGEPPSPPPILASGTSQA